MAGCSVLTLVPAPKRSNWTTESREVNRPIPPKAWFSPSIWATKVIKISRISSDMKQSCKKPQDTIYCWMSKLAHFKRRTAKHGDIQICSLNRRGFWGIYRSGDDPPPPYMEFSGRFLGIILCIQSWLKGNLATGPRWATQSGSSKHWGSNQDQEIPRATFKQGTFLFRWINILSSTLSRFR